MRDRSQPGIRACLNADKQQVSCSGRGAVAVQRSFLKSQSIGCRYLLLLLELCEMPTLWYLRGWAEL